MMAALTMERTYREEKTKQTVIPVKKIERATLSPKLASSYRVES